MQTKRLLALVALVIIFVIGIAICNKSGDDSNSESSGIGFIGKVSEIKGELVHIRMQLQKLEADLKDLADKQSEAMRNSESTVDIDQKLEDTREKIRLLEAKEEKLNDQLSQIKK